MVSTLPLKPCQPSFRLSVKVGLGSRDLMTWVTRISVKPSPENSCSEEERGRAPWLFCCFLHGSHWFYETHTGTEADCRNGVPPPGGFFWHAPRPWAKHLSWLTLNSVNCKERETVAREKGRGREKREGSHVGKKLKWNIELWLWV